MHAYNRRVAELETTIRRRSLFEGLTPDECEVLGIAKVKRLLERRERIGESATNEPPEKAAECESFMRLVRVANSRVAELQEQGRLDLIVERLRTIGLWPDDKAN